MPRRRSPLLPLSVAALLGLSLAGCTGGDSDSDSVSSSALSSSSEVSATDESSSPASETSEEQKATSSEESAEDTASAADESDCASKTLATSGLPSGSIPSSYGTPYSYKIEADAYDPCADLSYVHLKGIFADPADVAAWESPTSAVIFFHKGEMITNPAPDMYYRVTSVNGQGSDSVSISVETPGAEFYMPYEDGGSVTVSWTGDSLNVDDSAMDPGARSDGQLILS